MSKKRPTKAKRATKKAKAALNAAYKPRKPRKPRSKPEVELPTTPAAGGLSAADYFSSDGGDYFTYDADPPPTQEPPHEGIVQWDPKASGRLPNEDQGDTLPPDFWSTPRDGPLIEPWWKRFWRWLTST